MNLSAPFIRRPIATILLTAGLAIAGLGAFFILPVAPLPNVEFPGVMVQATLAGASPANMATSVATPLERRLAVISGVNEITSRSTTGTTARGPMRPGRGRAASGRVTVRTTRTNRRQPGARSPSSSPARAASGPGCSRTC